MSGFTDRFGGEAIQPADVGYRAVALTSSQLTWWPEYATNSNVLAKIMEVTPSAPGFSIALPDATLASPGQQIIFTNRGGSNYQVTDFAGVALVTITPGQIIYMYLTSTATTGGTWQTLLLGVGSSTLDLSNAAGPGLTVSSAKLAVSPASSAVAGNRTIAVGDRATSFVWTGGVGTFTLPLSSTLQPFFFEVRNQGTGALTLSTTGGELIDSSASIALQLGESCWVHSGVGFWYTVGRGRSTQFAFTQLQKVVTGGTVTETLTEAANVVQTFTGTLVSNVDIVVPAIVQVYYVSNQTSGAFNFRVKNPGAGTTVSIPTGQNAVLFSDGTNVINASTTLAGISSLVLAAGSAGSPSLGVGATNTGIFSSGSNLLSVSANSTKVADFSTAGLSLPINNGVIEINATSGNATYSMVKPSGGIAALQILTGANLRWKMLTSGTESGGNVGCDLIWQAYSDGGSPLNSAMSMNRATGLVTFPVGISAVSIAGAAATITSASSTATISIIDTGSQGANLRFVGNGGTTPNKFIRSFSGNMEWVNSAYNTVICTLSDTGNLTALGNVTAFSDRRIKDEIKQAFGALTRICSLRGVTFVRTDRDREPGRGGIAQEWEEVYPELIHRNGDGVLSINYTGMAGEYVEAFKEMRDEYRQLVSDLTGQVQSLLGQVQDLAAKLEAGGLK